MTLYVSLFLITLIFVVIFFVKGESRKLRLFAFLNTLVVLINYLDAQTPTVAYLFCLVISLDCLYLLNLKKFE